MEDSRGRGTIIQQVEGDSLNSVPREVWLRPTDFYLFFPSVVIGVLLERFNRVGVFGNNASVCAFRDFLVKTLPSLLCCCLFGPTPSGFQLLVFSKWPFYFDEIRTAAVEFLKAVGAMRALQS